MLKYTADVPDASTKLIEVLKIIQVSPVMSPLHDASSSAGVGLESMSGSIIIVAAGLCSK